MGDLNIFCCLHALKIRDADHSTTTGRGSGIRVVGEWVEMWERVGRNLKECAKMVGNSKQKVVPFKFLIVWYIFYAELVHTTATWHKIL